MSTPLPAGEHPGLPNREPEPFTTSVSRDLRVPLCMIDGFARLLLDLQRPTVDGPAVLRQTVPNAWGREQRENPWRRHTCGS